MKVETTYAVLKKEEEPDGFTEHGVLYRFRYDEYDVFFVYSKGAWIEQPSTCFDFMDVAK